MYYDLNNETRFDTILSRAAFLNFLLLLTVVLCASYFYFLNSSVSDVMKRDENTHNAANISAEISFLENKYIDLKSSIDMKVAESYGMEDSIARVSFSNETLNAGGRLSLSGNENGR